MSKYSGIPYHVPNTKYDEEQKEEAFNTIIGSKRAILYEGFGTSDFKTIENTIRYMVKGKDCEYIFLDHITALADRAERDKRKRGRI